MEKFFEEIYAADAAGDFNTVRNLLLAKQNGADLYHDVYRQLQSARFFEAQSLARTFMPLVPANPILFLAQAIGGFLFGNPEDERTGAAELSAHIDLLAPEQQAVIAHHIVHPAITKLATTSLIQHAPWALRLLAIYSAGFPMFRRMFEWTETVPRFDLEAARRKGRERARLIPFRGPPEGAPRRPVRVVVGIRERVMPQDPNSRLHDHGYRLCSAMEVYGWHPRRVDLGFSNAHKDYDDLIAACEAEQADLLIFDDYTVLAEAVHPLRAQMIAALRQKLPDLKIVTLHLDPWAITRETMVSTSEPVDLVWSQFPSLPMWQEPSLANKTMFVPVTHALHLGRPVTPFGPKLKFVGSVAAFNWHRGFWTAMAAHGLPIEAQLSNHMDDGLSVIDSYILYLKRLETGGAVLNFSMRPDLTRTYTGRCFEAVVAGALLVQEETADMDHYLLAGEHYLSFDTVGELRSIARFVQEEPEQAVAIRRAGNDYVAAHYTDEKMIGYIDREIFYRDAE